MLMLRQFPLLILGALLLASLELHAAGLLKFEGRAVSLETGELYYTESHQVILEDSGAYRSALVVYKTPTGEVLAEKTLDYAKSQSAPDMMFHDKRTDERVTVNLNPKDKNLRLLYEQSNARREKSVTLDDETLVVDAGFNRYIDSAWSILVKRKPSVFSFLAITRAQLFNFEAVPIGQTESNLIVELHPNNFLINWLVDPIKLTYDKNSQRLLRFEGLTNIERIDEGNRTYSNYVARIDYTYEPIKPYAL